MLEPDTQASLLVPGLGPVAGAIRWSADGAAGIDFNRPISIHSLMAWLVDRPRAEAPPPVPIGSRANHSPGDSLSQTVKTDILTGLPDRAWFLTRLDGLIAASAAIRPLAIGILDVDGFKAVNDTLGHDTGDGILIAVAERIRGVLSGDCVLARLGGDEFAFLVPPGADTSRTAEAIRGALRRPMATPHGERTITGCIGIAAFPRDGASAIELIRNADVALYTAQQVGRDRHACFTPDMLANVTRKEQLARQFEAALRNGEFAVHYEPIVPLDPGCGLKAEALLRWHHPQRGLLRAGQFGDVFADDMLAAQVGRFVIEAVISQIETWRLDAVPVETVTVNATLADFRSPDFVDRILEAIAGGQIKPSEIGIEITKTSFLTTACTASARKSSGSMPPASA